MSSGRSSRVRKSLGAPVGLIRLVLRDPRHVPERLTLLGVERQATAASDWAQRVRETEPETPVAALADDQRRRTISTARVDGAIAGTPFFIALVPAYLAFLLQEVRMHLRIAALYGHDTADPRVAADFLVLRKVHPDTDTALAELDKVRAQPMPSERDHLSLREWYDAVINVLVIAGFMAAPERSDHKPTIGQRIVYGVSFVVASLIWILTWVVPVTFMIVMSWACESDARRFGERVVTHYGDGSADMAATIAKADRRAGGNRAVSFARGALVVLSVALPLALIASTLIAGTGPLGVNVPMAFASLAALALVIGVSVVAVRG